MITPKKQLKKLRKDSAPRTAFKRELWSELDTAFRKEYPSFRHSFKRVFVIPIAAFVVFISMGTGVYAYASPEVTEDSTLYPIKHRIEQIEEKLHISPESRARFHARMVARRIAEGEVMLNRGTISQAHLIRIAEEFGYTIEDLIEIKENPELREEVKQDFIEHFDIQKDRYKYLIERSEEIEQEIKDEFKEDYINGEIDREELRNKFDEIRVRIRESDLSFREKRALFLELENELDINHNIEE